MNDEERLKVRRACTRALWGHGPQSPRAVLTALAELADPAMEADSYGHGALIEEFEAKIATLLGKEAAVFMPSGTMAQVIAVRLWAERRVHPAIAFHPTCHLELHEHHAYRWLHALHGVPVGAAQRLMTVADLARVTDPLAALVLELPQREIGGQLPSWEELGALMDWAQERGVPLHLDGARLWECGPFYGRPYAEIAAPFDSVYVSFYKGLGGIAGAALAGPAEFVAAARTWQRRHGGNLVSLWPYVLAAQKGLAERLPRMGAYHARAVEIAAALAEIGIPSLPDPPHTNMMHLQLPGTREQLEAALLETSRESGTWIFLPLRPDPFPTHQRAEFVVGDATLGFSVAEVQALFATVLRHAGIGD